jgi:hypothetical protein
MAVTKNTRTAHVRFLLQYALNEFVQNHIPEGEDLETALKSWQGSPDTFRSFGDFLDVLISQYELTDESLINGKSMDCLEVYNHLFRAMMEVQTDQKTRKELVQGIRQVMKPLVETYPFLAQAPVDKVGIEVLNINVLSGEITYKNLRSALKDLFRAVAHLTRETVGNESYKNMIFDHTMPYVKRDIERLRTYAILDDVISCLF